MDSWEISFSALDLDLEQTLGVGAFGKVVEARVNVAAIPTCPSDDQSPARHLQPGTRVAVKLLHG